MTALLRRKECLDGITDDRPATVAEEKDGAKKAATLVAQQKYDERNNKAIGHITDHLDQSALMKVKDDGESAKKMWSTLKDHYKNKSMANQLTILTRLINLRMSEGTN